MAFRVGVELSALIAAIAPVSGCLCVRAVKLERDVRLLFIAGADDPLLPLEGGVAQNPWGEMEENPPMEESFRAWAELIGCPSGPPVVHDVDGVRRLAYRHCRDGSEALFYIVQGLGHVWPGGKSVLSERVFGKPSDRLKGTDVIWEFFQRHATPRR